MLQPRLLTWASPGCSATHTCRCSPVQPAHTLTQVRQARTEVPTRALTHLALPSPFWRQPLGLRAAPACSLFAPQQLLLCFEPDLVAAVCGPSTQKFGMSAAGWAEYNLQRQVICLLAGWMSDCQLSTVGLAGLGAQWKAYRGQLKGCSHQQLVPLFIMHAQLTSRAFGNVAAKHPVVL